MNQRKKFRLGWIFVVILFLFIVVWGYKTLLGSFSFMDTIVINDGDSPSRFYKDLPFFTALRIRMSMRDHEEYFKKLESGSYNFTGSYTPDSFVGHIMEGPRTAYTTIKILEGWSIYDIDYMLSQDGLIKSGMYIEFVSDPSIISKYQDRYPFLHGLSLKTLEGFLYPDTYKIDSSKNIFDQLVYLQLENFKNKISDNISTPQGQDRYQKLILASIVEKEERNSNNRPTVAGILLKRLQIGMLIGADISLCYHFTILSKDCTPDFIVRHVSDVGNPYNTRTARGLPPTPIGNPSIDSITAVLHPNSTTYLFYLHDNQGIIHYAEDLDGHNRNKSQYIK